MVEAIKGFPRVIYSLLTFRLPEDDVKTATGAAAVFNLMGMPIQLFILRARPEIPLWPVMLSLLISFFILMYVLFGKTVRKRVYLQWAFVLNAAFISLALYVIYSHQGALSQGWFPFQASKLGAIVAGVLAPGPLAGLAGIAIHGGLAAFQYLLFPGPLRQALGPSEPWAIFAFTLGGGFILIYRLRVRQLQERLVQTSSQAEATRQLTESFLVLRDLMNTPVQSIEIATHLLSAGKFDASVLEHLRESCERLRKINLMLRDFEQTLTTLNWKPIPPNTK